MNISLTSNNTVTLTSKNRTVSLGAGVTIGEMLVPGAGEYDVNGIQCEALNLSSGIAYFLRLEELTITYLSEANAEASKLDDASATDILVIDLRSDDTAEKIKPILKGLEPAYLYLIGAGATKELEESLDVPTQAASVLKTSRSGLPLEGTFLIIPE